MPDLSKYDAAPLLDVWREVVSTHDCWKNELALDAAIRAGLRQEATIARQGRELAATRLTVAQLHQRIAAQEAQIRRLTEGGPRTRSERIAATMQALRTEGRG